MAHMKPVNFDEATTIVLQFKRPLLISHEKPDGDALGSLFALRAFLRSKGVNAEALLYDDVPERYVPWIGEAPMPILNRNFGQADLAACDAVIMLDTCSRSQLQSIIEWVASSELPTLAVDHHITRDAIADQMLVDEHAAATCLILHEWAVAAGWSVDRETAEALFVGMAMDTGWFHHSNTDARTLAAASALVDCGVQPHDLFERLFQQDSPARLRLQGEALCAMELSCEGRVAIMALSTEALERAGATSADTEDIVNEPLRIKDVVVSVLLVDQGEPPIRVNLRSKPPRVGGEIDVDVAAIAQSLGGGGHRRAAGVRLQTDLPSAMEIIQKAITQTLGA